MKVSEKMIRLGLIVMVALSFYFSYMIWLNPTGYDRSVEQATDTVNTSIQTYKQKSDLFLPLYLQFKPIIQALTNIFICNTSNSNLYFSISYFLLSVSSILLMALLAKLIFLLLNT